MLAVLSDQVEKISAVVLEVGNIVVSHIGASMAHERIWTFIIVLCNIDDCRQTSFKEHIKTAKSNTGKLWNAELCMSVYFSLPL